MLRIIDIVTGGIFLFCFVVATASTVSFIFDYLFDENRTKEVTRKFWLSLAYWLIWCMFIASEISTK